MRKGFISTDQYQQRQADLLGQRQAFKGLQREHSATAQQLTELLNELASLAIRQVNELAPTRRQLLELEQELAESEAKRTLLITAPGTGIATAVLADVGQTVVSAP